MCLLLSRPTASCCAGAAVLAVGSLCNIAAQGEASLADTSSLRVRREAVGSP